MGLHEAYWNYRLTRLRMKRPEFAMLDLLMSSRDRETGNQRSYLERVKGMYRLGGYYTEKGLDALADLAGRFLPDPQTAIDKSLRLKDRDWSHLDESLAGADEADAGEGVRDEPRAERMDGHMGTEVARPRRPGVRVEFNPDNPENRISSNYVGPERQMNETTDPWPLDHPPQKPKVAR